MFTIFNRLKKYLPYILIIIIGLSITGGSFYYLRQRYAAAIETKPMPVLSRNIGVHEEIRLEDIKTTRVPINQDTSMFISNINEAVGKIANSEIKADVLILKSSLKDKKNIEGKEYVTIKVDYAQTGGAVAGDIVDVYQVNPSITEWIPSQEPILIMNDALVVEITNSEGSVKSTSSSRTNLGGGSTPVKTEVIKLCVNPGQAYKLVAGSLTSENGLVLVVKK